MATYSKKGEDATEVERSLMKDTPGISDSEITRMRSAGRFASADDVGGLGARNAAWDALTEMSDASADYDDHGIIRAANDDRKPVGPIAQPPHRRPAGTPFIIASLFTALWTIAAVALIYGFGGYLRQMSGAAGWAPAAIGLTGAYGAPIIFFYALASMMARLNELRIVSSSMAEATRRFAEPETVACDSVITIGQAIRREVAAMGDGVERTLARAVELETLVNNEVAILERAYSENEVRIRTLLAGLAQQREILVDQAEQVRNAIAQVHLDLSQDVTTVSELIAERVNEAAQRVTRELANKGEQITIALGTAGDTMIEQLGERGADLLKRVERTSESAGHAIDAAGDRLTSGLNFKSDHLSEQVLTIATNLRESLTSRLDDVVGGFSQKSTSVLETVESRTRELAATISDRSETVSQTLVDAAGRIAETISARADEVNHSLKTTGEAIVVDLSLRGGDMVSKLEDIGHRLTDSIASRSDDITRQFGTSAETLAASIASRGDMMRDLLAQRLQSFEEVFSHSGTELAERIARDSAQLGELITRHLTDFDRTVRGHGGELVENLAQRTADIQELVATAVATRDGALTAAISSKIDEANTALSTRATEVADNLERQIGRFEELLINRTGAAARETTGQIEKAAMAVEARTHAAADYAASTIDRIAHEVGSRTGAAVERAAMLVGKATEAIESRTHAAAAFAASRLTGVAEEMETRSVSAAEEITAEARNATQEIGRRTAEAFSQLLERSGNVSRELETHAQAATDLMQARAADLSHLLDEASSGLIAAISSKGGEFAAEIELAAQSAARTIDNKAFAFTQSMMNNSNELARVITDASTTAASIVNRTLKELQDSTRNSLSQATIMVAQTLKELQNTTKGAIEQSKGVAMATVSEIHETHDMLRTDATILFERLRDANGLLQDVLGGARSNHNAIEQVLSTRVVEFVSTVEQLLENTDNASGKLDRQVSSFYGLTSRVLGDLGELAVQFDGHGKALADAVTLLDKANADTIASVKGRKNVIEELAEAMDSRAEQLDNYLKRFSNLIDVSLRSAEDRARDAARLVAEATSEGARTLAERHAAIRSTTEQEGEQTLASLRELHQRVSSETKDLFQHNAGEATELLQQATDRFAEIMHSMKKMSLDMQRELEATRKELRRGVLELPEETAESMAQMRRVIVDQMEALAELNRIVARHGRAMDTAAPAVELPLRRGYGDGGPVVPAPAAVPESTVRPEPAGPGWGRASAAAPAPEPVSQQAMAGDRSAARRSRVETPPEPATRQAAGADRGAAQRGRIETLPEPATRQAVAGGDRDASQRGRIEMAPEPATRQAVAGGDRDASQRGRIEMAPEPATRQATATADWTAPPRGRVEAPPVAPAGQDVGRTDDEAGGGWLSNLLTRASQDDDEPAHNEGLDAFMPPHLTATKDQRAPREEDHDVQVGLESVDSLSVDIARMIDHEAAADFWERHNRGERNVFTRRLYTTQGRKAFDEVRKRYRSDREFHQAVDLYIGEFERLLGEVGHEPGGPVMARSYLTSETGMVYTMLAHAAGRFE